MAMTEDTLLEGAYDIHVHCSPDVIARAEDFTSLARSASQARMQGLVLKDHTTSTVGRVYALNQMYRGHPRFYSALALNPPVGSLNPAAVEAALKAGVNIIYFPTYGSRHHVSLWGAGRPPTAFPLAEENYQGVTILDEVGDLEPACQSILRLIARHDAVLATGHLSPVESLALLKAARRAGIGRLLVTHASLPVTAMSVAQQQEVADLGAMIEHSFFAASPGCPNPLPLADIANQIRQVGIRHVILSSDFGQEANGEVVAAFAAYLRQMMALGFSTREIRSMIVDNPKELLDSGH
jgi:GNAT superfamily N-acetyltransferase